MGVVFICIAIILAMAARYVVRSNTNDAYGNRLDGIKDVLIEDDKKDEIEEKINEMDKVSNVTINIHGKIIYFDVDFEKDATVDEAKNVATKCLDYFEEDYKNFYDMQFLFTKKDLTDEEKGEDKFPIIGYIKAGAPTISWSNNAN